jgi:hypothetical protein
MSTDSEELRLGGMEALVSAIQQEELATILRSSHSILPVLITSLSSSDSRIVTLALYLLAFLVEKDASVPLLRCALPQLVRILQQQEPGSIPQRLQSLLFCLQRLMECEGCLGEFVQLGGIAALEAIPTTADVVRESLGSIIALLVADTGTRSSTVESSLLALSLQWVDISSSTGVLRNAITVVIHALSDPDTAKALSLLQPLRAVMLLSSTGDSIADCLGLQAVCQLLSFPEVLLEALELKIYRPLLASVQNAPPDIALYSIAALSAIADTPPGQLALGSYPSTIATLKSVVCADSSEDAMQLAIGIMSNMRTFLYPRKEIVTLGVLEAVLDQRERFPPSVVVPFLECIHKDVLAAYEQTPDIPAFTLVTLAERKLKQEETMQQVVASWQGSNKNGSISNDEEVKEMYRAMSQISSAKATLQENVERLAADNCKLEASHTQAIHKLQEELIELKQVLSDIEEVKASGVHASMQCDFNLGWYSRAEVSFPTSVLDCSTQTDERTVFEVEHEVIAEERASLSNFSENVELEEQIEQSSIQALQQQLKTLTSQYEGAVHEIKRNKQLIGSLASRLQEVIILEKRLEIESCQASEVELSKQTALPLATSPCALRFHAILSHIETLEKNASYRQERRSEDLRTNNFELFKQAIADGNEYSATLKHPPALTDSKNETT